MQPRPANTQAGDLDWGDLRVFLAVARHGSFAGAGRDLGVNATTASRRLAALEESIGAQLFQRTADGLVPTASGEAIIEPAELMERQAQLIAGLVGGQDAELAGLVRVSVTSGFASAFLIDHLSPLRGMYPDIDIELNTSDQMVDLSRGGADIAVRFRTPGSGPGAGASGPVEIVARRVSAVGISVFGAKDYLARRGCPAHATDVAGHSIIMPRESARYLPGSDWSQRIEADVSVALRADSMGAIGSAAAAGFGLCAIPCFYALAYDNLLRVSPPDVIDTREIWLLMPGDLRRVGRVRAVWDFLVAMFDAWAPVLSGEALPPQRDAVNVFGG